MLAGAHGDLGAAQVYGGVAHAVVSSLGGILRQPLHFVYIIIIASS